MMIQEVSKFPIHNVAIYMRLSKDDGDREESESISNQRAIILNYIENNFNYEKYYEYVDDGVSGATFNRPGFKKMIAELKVNKIDLVITKNLARFARNYIDAGDYIEKLFPDNNIRYIAILDGIDNFEDRIENEFAPIKGVFNELFCKETSKSIKKTKRKKMQDGIYSCNTAPYGYKKDLDHPGKLIIDKEASKIVKRIFKLNLKGKTAKEIADLFNKEKILTPSEHLKIKGLENRTKKMWTRTMVFRILANEVYTGKCVRGKTQNISYKNKKRIYIKRNEQIKTENTHEAIIDIELFNSVHKQNKFGKVYNNEIQKITTKFANYMYCGNCGKKMAKRRSRNYLNIYCPKRNESDLMCSNKKIYKYEDLEIIILRNIEKKFENYFKKNNLTPSLIKKYNDMKIRDIDNELKTLNKDFEILKFEISKLYSNRLQESISEESYQNKYKDLTNKRIELNRTIKRLKEDKENIKNESKNTVKINQIEKILKNINKDTLSLEDVGELIEKIDIFEKKIHIFYKFENITSKFISCHYGTS